ncbi:inositol polyphosphate multikinase IPK2-like isoform X2 [Homarus americanus]|uniref:inositol polyphosphate multikinase IPK2-like isoform X2 n=1 Tax=Homarus americanus TaxID=6706 RepID=UPI001C47B229|nr:inositol polyphosphate multikinase IPK2-like isoform X2 [Homarus americanus]
MSVELPYEAYSHQVGGWHKGKQTSVLRGENGLILKPLKLNANPTYSQVMKGTNTSSQSSDKKLSLSDEVCQDELGFYERLQSSTSPDDLKLKTLLPKFHGVHQVIKDGEAVPHLVLEDLAHGFEQPCVADIKIGRTFYYPGQKKYKEKEKYATQSESGFCVTGLRVYHVETGCLVTELRPDECKRLTTAQVFEGLETFCQHDTIYGNDLRHALAAELRHIHDWYLSQHSYKVRCGSILMVYDAKQTFQSPSRDYVSASVTGGESSPKTLPKVKVKVIDLAHVLYSDGERDENSIFGIENLLKFLTITDR